MFKPMLAAAVKNIASDIIYPCIATPKIDGIRCITLDLPRTENQRCVPVTRSLKPIPNSYINKEIAMWCPPGLDGELIVPDSTFQGTSSGIMSFGDTPEFEYHVFDYLEEFTDKRWTKGVMTKYTERLTALEKLNLPKFCHIVPTYSCDNLNRLMEVEAWALEEGFEGLCVRAPHSPYKFGRSTVKEGWLMKIKRFQDSEARVIGFEELMHNANEIKDNPLKASRRHSYQSGMVPRGVLGSLIVEDLKTKVQFSVGSGFSQNERKEIWENQMAYIHKTLTYKFQPHGVKDKPRCPIFKAWRPQEDLL